jgi:hypothetical protein
MRQAGVTVLTWRPRSCWRMLAGIRPRSLRSISLVGATDPGPDLLIRRGAVEIVVKGDG